MIAARAYFYPQLMHVPNLYSTSSPRSEAAQVLLQCYHSMPPPIPILPEQKRIADIDAPGFIFLVTEWAHWVAGPISCQEFVRCQDLPLYQ
jgi:hypothetical protein